MKDKKLLLILKIVGFALLFVGVVLSVLGILLPIKTGGMPNNPSPNYSGLVGDTVLPNARLYVPGLLLAIISSPVLTLAFIPSILNRDSKSN